MPQRTRIHAIRLDNDVSSYYWRLDRPGELQTFPLGNPG